MTQEIRIENLRNHPKNLRKKYGDLRELTASIKENGILQNLVVVPDPKNNETYLVVAGNCRLRAAKKAGLETVPCNITDMSEKTQVLTMLNENMQRKDLTFLEEANGIQMCLEDFGMKMPELASATGLSVSTIRSRKNIAQLDAEIVREKLNDTSFQLSIGNLNALTKIKDIEKRNEILQTATDSKNLICKVNQAVEDELIEKNYEILAARAEEEGITLNEDVSYQDLNTPSKWDHITYISLAKELPDNLLPSTDGEEISTEGLFYKREYRSFHIFRKHKRQKHEPTEEELKAQELKKNIKCIAELKNNMFDEMGNFIRNLVDGSIPEIDDISTVFLPLWTLLVEIQASPAYWKMVSVLYNCEFNKIPAEEKDTAMEYVKGLPMYQQLLINAFYSIHTYELANYQGLYNKRTGDLLLILYDVLNKFGFTFTTEEYDEVMIGTHELYSVPEEDEPDENPSEEIDVESTEEISDSEEDDADEDMENAEIEEFEEDDETEADIEDFENNESVEEFDQAA